MSDLALPEDDEMLAAELAFGLIDGAERAQAQARLARDETFAAAHARWQDYAVALFTGAGEAPRPSVWTAIEARLPANDTGAISRSTLRWWQVGAVAASVTALMLGTVAFQNSGQNSGQKPTQVIIPAAQAPVAPMVAVLTGKHGLVTVSYDPASGRMTSAASGVDLGDHVPELWVIPADGKPRSMGVMKTAAPGWAKVPSAAASALSAGVTIAVSVEPRGGSPTGLPTGAVILTGVMTAVT